MPYIRFLLDEITHAKLKEFAEKLQLDHEGYFISQLHDGAQLGCHPFHITSCAGLGNIHENLFLLFSLLCFAYLKGITL
jgi:hypothetical protein